MTEQRDRRLIETICEDIGSSRDEVVAQLQRVLQRCGALSASNLTPALQGRGIALHGPAPARLWRTLAEDPAFHRLPDHRLVCPALLLDDATITARLVAARRGDVGLPANRDVAVVLARYRGWTRIPMSSEGRRGLATLADGMLRLPAALLDGAEEGQLLGLVPGPEGLHLAIVDPDPEATDRLGRALTARVRQLRASGVAPSIVDVELAAAAAMPALRRRPTLPVTETLERTRHRLLRRGDGSAPLVSWQHQRRRRGLTA